LDNVLKAISPVLKEKIEQRQPWGPAGAPYRIDEWNGKRRIIVVDPETGDTTGASGATLEEALANLERKVGLGQPAEQEG
jgi:hypothetical protein